MAYFLIIIAVYCWDDTHDIICDENKLKVTKTLKKNKKLCEYE